jgi:hypothetical protein
MFRFKLVQYTALASMVLLLGAKTASGQKPDETASVPSTGVTAVPKCKWKVERVYVVPAKLTGKDKKAVDEVLDALVKALGAAGPEVKAVNKAIDELGPGGDLVNVYVICACVDAAGQVVKRAKDSVDDTDEVHWAAKTSKLTGADKEDNDRTRKRIVNKVCAKHRNP